MELLQSDKFKLPVIYFISDRSRIKELPIGVPFIYGDESEKEYIIRILEYEVLYQKALSTGLPFNFKKLLKSAGFEGLEDFEYGRPVYIDYATSEFIEEGSDWDIDDSNSISKDNSLFKKYCKDSAVHVDIQKLKDLEIFPIWLDDIEKAVETNIHSFMKFNYNLYNKKLGGMFGDIELTSPRRNLIIIDISTSIPKGVSSTTLAMCKYMAETFFADIMITGSKTVLYEYENLHTLNVDTIYKEIGMGNEQLYFKKLVTSTVKHYDTCIVFGDNHHPGDRWCNKSSRISDKDGKKMCLWKVNNIISFHTTSHTELAGYARWFDVPEKNIKNIKDWVKYL